MRKKEQSKQYEVGETVTLSNGCKLLVTESRTCKECYFHLFDDCVQDLYLLSPCSKTSRTDKKAIIFKLIK